MDVRADNKPTRTSKFAYKLFGLPGVIAGKYYRRSRKRYRATVVSLFMSIVLFISASAFTDYLVKSSTGALSSEQFDLKYTTDLDTPDSKTPDELLALLSSEQNITGSAYAKSLFLQGDIPRKYVTDTYINRFADFGSAKDKTGTDTVGISGYLYFVDDAEFNRLLKNTGSAKRTTINKENPLGIAN